MPSEEDRLVMNGNQACALGAIAAGMELCAMYPITPATSVSHELAEIIRITSYNVCYTKLLRCGSMWRLVM